MWWFSFDQRLHSLRQLIVFFSVLNLPSIFRICCLDEVFEARPEILSIVDGLFILVERVRTRVVVIIFNNFF